MWSTTHHSDVLILYMCCVVWVSREEWVSVSTFLYHRKESSELGHPMSRQPDTHIWREKLHDKDIKFNTVRWLNGRASDYESGGSRFDPWVDRGFDQMLLSDLFVVFLSKFFWVVFLQNKSTCACSLRLCFLLWKFRTEFTAWIKLMCRIKLYYSL